MRWTPTNLSADEFSRPTEPPITCGLIYRGKRHAFSGPPESLKTLMALICGREHLRAGNGPFALIDFESGEHATRLMLEDLGYTADEIASVYYVDGAAGPPDAEDINALVEAGITLVIVDAAASAYGVSGLDDNARADAEKFAQLWIQPLWRYSIASVLIDHVPKAQDGRGKFAIGSERKLGTVDVHLGLEVIRPLHRGATGRIRIVTHKDRPGHLSRPRAAELDLASDPTTNRISWTFRPAEQDTAAGDSQTFRPTNLMEKVSRYLDLQSEPVSRSQVARDVRGKREYVLSAIDILITEGHATVTDGPNNARLITSVKPFREQPFPAVPGSSPAVPGNDTTSRSPFPAPIGRNGNGSVDPLDKLLADHADIAAGETA